MASEEHGNCTNINRDQSLFVGSRLYRQAEEGSRAILERFLDDTAPFEQPLLAVSGTTSCIVTSAADCGSTLAKARVYAEDKARALSTYTAIPVLLQAAT